MAIPLITSPLIEALKGIRHGFTTREGGVSEGPFSSLNLGWATGDQDDFVAENYRRLAQHFSVDATKVFGVRQVHGARVARVGGKETRENLSGAEADALITDEAGILLTVRVADCYPILLVDSKKKVIGVVHSGWRGTLENVLGATINAMCRELGAFSHHLVVAIGPGVSQQNYEVSSGVWELFRDRCSATSSEGVETPTGVKLSLSSILVRQALDAGVPKSNVSVADLCTVGDRRRFFSFRRDGKRSGRMVGAVGIAT